MGRDEPVDGGTRVSGSTRRWETMVRLSTASEYSRPLPACRERQLSGGQTLRNLRPCSLR